MKEQSKEAAIQLRLAGKSIGEISQQLGVSKSSVSIWVRQIVLTTEQKDKLLSNKKNGIKKSNLLKSEQAKLRWTKYKEDGYNKAKHDINFKIICALYWGEGSKSTKDFRIGNSDPKMIKLIVDWLVSNQYEYHFTIMYHIISDGLEIVKYWNTKVPLLEMAKTSKLFQYKADTKKRPSNKMPYGFGLISVYNTELHFNIMGGIDFLAESSNSIGRVLP